MIGAICATVTFHTSNSTPLDGGATPTRPSTSATERLTETANVCTSPISSEATNAPASEPSPPTTTTTNRIGPSDAAMFDWVTSAGPAITPATAASPVPTPNTSMNTLGTLWPSMATMCGWVSEAWMMSPTRVRVSTANSAAKIAIAVNNSNIL